MTFRPYRSLCRMLFTICLQGGIVALGDSILARCGGIGGNWLLKREVRMPLRILSACMVVFLEVFTQLSEQLVVMRIRI